MKESVEREPFKQYNIPNIHQKDKQYFQNLTETQWSQKYDWLGLSCIQVREDDVQLQITPTKY